MESLSLSSRRAWIEINLNRFRKKIANVALLTESVDWNTPEQLEEMQEINVALLTESVDWNSKNKKALQKIISVALLTESVDWNLAILIRIAYL